MSSLPRTPGLPDPPPFRRRLQVIFVVRSSLNAAHRIIYPFLPSIARGLDISLQAATGLVTLRMVAGLGAPLLGFVADRYGRRRTMELGLAVFVVASALLAGVGTLAAAGLAFGLYGLAKTLYDPAVHAYVGDSVPYPQRARAIGIVELSWSAAWLVGVPASGFLIEHLGWRTPWAALILLGLVGLALTHTQLPPAHNPQPWARDLPLMRSIYTTWAHLLRKKTVRVLLLTSLLLVLANEVPFIVYGAWLESTFGLSLSTLGLASVVIGVAEAVSEIGTALLTDRLGKRRSVLLGLLGLVVSLAALPLLSQCGLGSAMAGMILMILCFEFAIVSLLPLATELAPEARASLLALFVTALSVGRIIGALLGGWLWQWGSFAIHAGVGAACALGAGLLLGLGMTEPGSVR